jgi:monoamine oxidase
MEKREPSTNPASLRMTRRALLESAAAAGAGLLLPRNARSAPSDAALYHARRHPSGAHSADVVVIGAGLAGLNAARLLTAAGLDVIVLEARGRVGGRTLNHDLGDGRVIEVGGQWIGPLPDEPATATIPTQAVYRPQAKLHELAQSLGIGTFKTYNAGDIVDFNSGIRTTYSAANRIPLDLGALDAGEAIFLLNQMAAQVDAAKPFRTPSPEKALEWDSISFETWMQQNLLPPGLKPDSAFYSLVNLAVESVFAAEPRDMSLLHVLFYIASAGTLDNLVNTANGAQDSRFIGGSQLISIRVAQALGDRVILDAPVRKIVQSTSHVEALGDGFSVGARAAIVATPPTLAGKILYEPSLAVYDGGRRDQLTQRTPMGTVIKVQALYEKPFWRDMGLAGQATSDTGPVKVTFDNSPYPDPQTGSSADVSPGVLIGFIEGADGRVYGQPAYDGPPFGNGKRKADVLASFARYFGDQALSPIGYVEMAWAREEFTGGCYGAFLGPGAWTSYGEALGKPLGLVHWAGTETASVWSGYMDGAVRSGEQAASDVIALLGSA